MQQANRGHGLMVEEVFYGGGKKGDLSILSKLWPPSKGSERKTATLEPTLTPR